MFVLYVDLQTKVMRDSECDEVTIGVTEAINKVRMEYELATKDNNAASVPAYYALIARIYQRTVITHDDMVVLRIEPQECVSNSDICYYISSVLSQHAS